METAWYMQQKPPVFCNPLRPAYVAIRPYRKCVLFVGVSLLASGLLMFLCAIIFCIAVRCYGASVGSFWFFGFLFVLIGLLLFHCGWAAYLLDEVQVYKPSYYPPPHPAVISEQPQYYTDGQYPRNEGAAPNAEYIPPPTGYWVFVEKPAWQAVSSRETLQ